MAVTSGFFNSLNGDRKYNALQVGELFDGLINDGVYETIYNKFRVRANEGMYISVDTGRGWFQHTWIKNDNLKLIALPPSELLFDRIDAIVIEVDHSEPVRKSDIKYVKGTPSSNPQKPTLKKGTGNVWQYPLSYVRVRENSESINSADIENTVGTSACPFVTGVVSVMDIDMLISQWGAQWSNWYSSSTTKYDTQWHTWYRSHALEFEETWRVWYQTNTDQYSYDFNTWFSQLQVMLDENVATNLANQIVNINKKFEILMKEHTLYDPLRDSDGEPILDSNENEIDGATIFMTKDECKCR